MQCPKCKGNVIKKDGIFECENCGAHFKGKSKKEEAEKVEEAPIITEPKEEYTEPSEPFYDVSKEFKQESDPFDVKESKEYASENDVYEAPKYDNSSYESHDSLAQYVKKNPRDPEGFYEKAYDYIKDNSSVSDNTYRSILNIALNNADPNYVESYVAMVHKLKAKTKVKKTDANIYKNVTASNGIPMPKRIPISTETRPQKNTIQGIMAKVGNSIPQKNANKAPKQSAAKAPREGRGSTVSRGKSFLILGFVLVYIAIMVVGTITIKANIAKIIFYVAMVGAPLIIGIIIALVSRRRNGSGSARSGSGMSKKKKIIILASTAGVLAVAAAVILIGGIPTLSYQKMTSNNTRFSNVDTERTELNSYNGTISTGETVVTGVKGLYMPFHFPMSNVVIPAKVGNSNVVAIQNSAFYGDNNIKTVTLGENIRYVGGSAFSGCNNLTMVYLNSKVEKIETSAISTKVKINYPHTSTDLQSVLSTARNYDVTYGGKSKSGGSTTNVPASQYFTVTNDNYYPWATTSTSITSTNTLRNSTSVYRFTFSASGTFRFNESISANSSDYLFVYKNGSILSGYTLYGSDSKSSVNITVTRGDYIEFKFEKNASTSTVTNGATISNISFTSGAIPSSSSSSSTSVPTSSYFTVRNDYAYPWTTTSTSITSTNKSSSSNSVYRFTFSASGTFRFNESISSNSYNDYIKVYKNGNIQSSYTLYGTDSKSGNSISVTNGDVIEFKFERGTSTSTGTNSATISNISFTYGTTPSSSSGSSSVPQSMYFSITNDYSHPWTFSNTSSTSVNAKVYDTFGYSSSTLTYRFTQSGTVSIEVSGHSNSSSSYCEIYIRGSYVTSVYGTSSWTRSYSVSSGDEIVFVYYKNNSSTSSSTYMQANITFSPSQATASSSIRSSSGSSSRPNSDYFYVTNDSVYPWAETSTSITSTNKTDSSSSKYRFTFYYDGTFSFSESASTESGYDKLNVYLDGSILSAYTISGTESNTNCSIRVSAGDYIEFEYNKDSSSSSGSDTVTVSNISFARGSSSATSTSSSSSQSLGYTTTNDSNYRWTVSGDSITSTNKTNNSTSTYRYTFNKNGRFVFSAEASSQSGGDYLRVYKNGTELTEYRISGTQTLNDVMLNVSEGDYIEFKYTKNASGSSNNDNVTVYDISFTETKTGVTGFENYFYTVNDSTHPWIIFANTGSDDMPIIFDEFATGTSTFTFEITRSGTLSFSLGSNLQASNYAMVYKNGTSTNYQVTSSTNYVNVSLNVNYGDTIQVVYTKNNSTINTNYGVAIDSIQFIAN